MAQRCAAVAAGQTEPPEAAKGRAKSERRSIAAAARPYWGGRGPQIIGLIPFCVVLGILGLG